MRQRQENVTFSDAVARKIDTQKNNTRTGHRRDKDKRATTVTTACNRSTCQVTSKLDTRSNNYYLRISYVYGLHLWLLGALVYLTLFGIDTVENSLGVNWIYRDLPRNIQSFGSISVCVFCNNNDIRTREQQQWWQHAMDPLDRSLPSYPLSERLLTFLLLTSYFVWWRFILVTVERAIIPYLVWYRHRWEQLRCKLNI